MPVPLHAQSAYAPILLAWYDRSRRDLPWRAADGVAPDPYAVWLSEIMLQQTTVAVVRGYYARFLALWPTVQDLAAASLDDVLRAWAGLGYYARARNLHACAKAVAHDHGGRFPATEQALLSLPGIGPYTAAAIAAIAFDARAVVVDGNVERVVARVFALDRPLPGVKADMRAAAAAITPDCRAGDFAQAMMDLGATLCTPRRPACTLCPFVGRCLAQASADPERFPVRGPKKLKPQRFGTVFVWQRDDGAVLLRQRPPRGLLGGMAECPGSAWEAAPATGTAAAPVDADWRQVREAVEHVFTHFTLHLTVFLARAAPDACAPEGCRFVAAAALETEALPSLMRKVLAAAHRAPKPAD